METNWAEEHLQTIRTLMERSAVYRRALAPIMVWNGIVGVVVGAVGWKLGVRTCRTFVEVWSGAAVVAIIGSFLLVRRQALKDAEPFWSPPTRRIAQAVLPPFIIGAFLNLLALAAAYMNSGAGGTSSEDGPTMPLVICWLCLYGCAAHASGFFTPRGMKLFGWLFIFIGCAIAITMFTNPSVFYMSSSLLMGATFGVLHLAYGIYLYLTEKGKNAA